MRAGETVEASVSQRNKAAGAALSSTPRGPVATALHVDLSPTPLGCVTSGKFSTSLGLGPHQANRDEKALLRRQCQEDSGRSSAECRLRPLQITLCSSQSLPSLGLIQTLCAFPPWGCLGSWVGGHIGEGASLHDTCLSVLLHVAPTKPHLFQAHWQLPLAVSRNQSPPPHR